jgi:hypothetical protein
MKKLLLLLIVFAAGVLVVKATTDEPYGASVVFKNAVTNTNSNVSTTTMWTPSTNGFYVVNAYEQYHSSSSGGCGNIIASATLTNGVSVSSSMGGYSNTYEFYAEAGQPIQYSFTLNGGASCDWAIELIKE